MGTKLILSPYDRLHGERVVARRRRRDGVIAHCVRRWGRDYWTVDGVTYGSFARVSRIGLG